jgi:hypothetical protein
MPEIMEQPPQSPNTSKSIPRELNYVDTRYVMSAGAKIDHEAPRDRGFVAV